MSADLPGIVSVTEGGVTVVSNSETAAQITETLKPSEEKPDLSRAASELGKKGGEAAAEARAEKAKEAAKEAKQEAKAEQETPEEPEPAPGEKPEKSRAQLRVEEATRAAAEARREAAQIRQEKARLEGELAEVRRAREAPQTPQTPQRDATAKPKADDFESYDEYLDARDVWNRKQWEAESAKDQKEMAYHQGVNQRVSTFIESMDKAETDDPAFHEKVAPFAVQMKPSFKRAKGEALEPIHVITDEIIGAGKLAPVLALHLAEHPEDRKRIESLGSPTEIQLAMAHLQGRIEARLDGATAGNPPSDERPAPKPEVSRAKPPVRPVAGSPHTADQEPGENASYEAHRAYWGRKDKEASRR